eukprot:Awhi_evm1s13383
MNKAVIASSSILDPNYATNGNVHDPFESFHSKPLDTLQWVEVDLQASYNLAEVHIHNRYSYGHSRITGFDVQLLNKRKEIVYEYSYYEWNA